MIEPENSTEEGTSATKDLINVAFIIRRVRLHNEQYCFFDAGANVSNTWRQSVMVGRGGISLMDGIEVMRADTRSEVCQIADELRHDVLAQQEVTKCALQFFAAV